MSGHSHHDHDHDHNCACGHDHGDAHSHNEHIHEEHEAIGQIQVACHLHDEARVVSGTLAVFADYEQLKPVLSAQLEALAKAVQERGGIVGHIKASCQVQRVEMFSVTDVTVSVKSAPEQEIKINVASIVFAVDPDEVERLVISALEAVRNSV